MANLELDSLLEFHESFFSKSECDFLTEKLLNEIHWEQKTIHLFGKAVLEPRLTAWYGDPGATYTYSGAAMAPRPWNKTLLKIKSRVELFCGHNFNSVLLNLYRNHRDSMGMHSDDEKELGKNPVIASVSFGATRRFILTHRMRKELPQTYWLHSGSLLIMKGSLQNSWKHGIPKETKPCGPRINLTFRKIFI